MGRGRLVSVLSSRKSRTICFVVLIVYAENGCRDEDDRDLRGCLKSFEGSFSVDKFSSESKPPDPPSSPVFCHSYSTVSLRGRVVRLLLKPATFLCQLSFVSGSYLCSPSSPRPITPGVRIILEQCFCSRPRPYAYARLYPPMSLSEESAKYAASLYKLCVLRIRLGGWFMDLRQVFFRNSNDGSRCCCTSWCGGGGIVNGLLGACRAGQVLIPVPPASHVKFL